MTTAFVAAYDTEAPEACLAACERIAALHREMNVRATFFMTTRLLDSAERDAYRELLDDDLFEIASHTVNHVLIRDHPVAGHAAAPREKLADELARSKATIEDAFGRSCTGLRAPVGYTDGLGTDSSLIELVAGCGYGYSSSQLWGPQSTMPALLEGTRDYAAQGFADLWEFPAHGWHENLLKGHNATPGRYLLWPPAYPDLVIDGYVKTPAEECAVHSYFVDRAADQGLEYVSLIWHPWSLGRFDPEMQMPRLLFEHARERGLEFETFARLRSRLSRGRSRPPASPA